MLDVPMRLPAQSLYDCGAHMVKACEAENPKPSWGQSGLAVMSCKAVVRSVLISATFLRTTPIGAVGLNFRTRRGGSLQTDLPSSKASLNGTVSNAATLGDRVPVIGYRRNYRAALTSINRKWIRGFMLLRVLLTAVSVLNPSPSDAAATSDAIGDTEEICMPAGTYPMIGGGATVFSHNKTCFSRPVTNSYSSEKKIPRAKRSAPDTFSGARVARYDYHDALYQCTKRGMRLPTVDELKALFAYANTADAAVTGSRYAIVAPKDDSHYPGGRYGWGGASEYWSHTFAGKGFHKAVNLSDGWVGIYHDSRVGYVSCVR
ncbi:hypothetical protein [Paraburkholderia sp. RL17-337-BIB-A]|uniref:hypothetical protein n=1 Tax=Paraburkholderia sp. RL17-337-BIB-A TaxID=3031636 RepID=UPI0038BC3109